MRRRAGQGGYISETFSRKTKEFGGDRHRGRSMAVRYPGECVWETPCSVHHEFCLNFETTVNIQMKGDPGSPAVPPQLKNFPRACKKHEGKTNMKERARDQRVPVTSPLSPPARLGGEEGQGSSWGRAAFPRRKQAPGAMPEAPHLLCSHSALHVPTGAWGTAEGPG